jgi:hypothetical protein
MRCAALLVSWLTIGLAQGQSSVGASGRAFEEAWLADYCVLQSNLLPRFGGDGSRPLTTLLRVPRIDLRPHVCHWVS